MSSLWYRWPILFQLRRTADEDCHNQMLVYFAKCTSSPYEHLKDVMISHKTEGGEQSGTKKAAPWPTGDEEPVLDTNRRDT
jgi:hypothetical protein